MGSNPAHPDVETLYLRHGDTMYRAAHRVLRESGRGHLADDAVQQVFESLLRNPPSEPVDNWEAFLVRAAGNRALDVLKSATVRHTADKPVEDHGTAAKDDVAAEAVGRVDRSRLMARVREKMTLLSSPERYVLEQVAALGRPGTEVGTELGVTKGRISQLKTQALRKLRQMLDEEGVRE